MTKKLLRELDSTIGEIVLLLDGKIYRDFRFAADMEIEGTAVVVSCVFRDGVIEDISVKGKKEMLSNILQGHARTEEA